MATTVNNKIIIKTETLIDDDDTLAKIKVEKKHRDDEREDELHFDPKMKIGDDLLDDYVQTKTQAEIKDAEDTKGTCDNNIKIEV